MVAVAPATANQVGALHREFARLGYRRADRGERLAMAAALLNLETLASLRHLRQGQAGKLLHVLLTVSDRAELVAPAPAVESAPAAPSLLAMLGAVVAAWRSASLPRNASRPPETYERIVRIAHWGYDHGDDGADLRGSWLRGVN